MLKISEVRELIRLLDETSLSEIHVEYDDMKLHLKKPTVEYAQVQAVPAPVLQAQAPVATPAAVAQPVAVQPENNVVEPVVDANVHIVTSPMVGTFYRSPSPDAPAFADVGSQVGAKTVVCIVEAMKLMNEIEAEVTGEVIEVLAQNGQLVEYGQPLFKIRLA